MRSSPVVESQAPSPSDTSMKEMTREEFRLLLALRLRGYNPDSWVKVKWRTNLNDWIPEHTEIVKAEAVIQFVDQDLLSTGTITNIRIEPHA